jgi:Tfp pilus assembly protein PilF
VELRLDRPTAALERLESALRAAEVPPVAYLVRAILRMREADLDGAEADLVLAATDVALAGEIAVRRATIALLRGDAEAALARATAILDDDPFDAAAQLVAAYAALELDRPGEARAHAEAALAVEPALEAARTVRDLALAAE